jgi:hypothetical protein
MTGGSLDKASVRVIRRLSSVGIRWDERGYEGVQHHG